MLQQKEKTGITPANGPRFKWLFIAIMWLAFTKLFFYAQEWFSIDRTHEDAVLNSLYYAMDGFFHVLVVYAGYKAGTWFSNWLWPLLIFFLFRLVLLVSFLLFDVGGLTEEWNFDLPMITSVLFVLCGIACLYLTLKDLIKRL